MINKTQDTFSIYDLEVLSGIKAHTIRTWEKRYNILNPRRLKRNIRIYNINDLKKILNLSLLVKDRHKISELAALKNDALEIKAKSTALKNSQNNFYVNSILLSMFSLDEGLFEEVYQAQKKKLSFTEIFLDTYLPLLNLIGTLWQTNEVQLVQEHFISNLIYRKIALNIELTNQQSPMSKKVYALFLPQGELHELGIFFITYLLKKAGKKTIYIGPNTPVEKLKSISTLFNDINWICSISLNRTNDEKEALINEIDNLLKDTNNICSLITGQDFDNLNIKYSSKIEFYKSHKAFVENYF